MQERYKIGNTPFHQSPETGHWLTYEGRMPVVYIKREDQNPGGTFKSRHVAAEIERYRNLPGMKVLAGITDGNLGRAGVELCSAEGSGWKFASIVDGGMPQRTKRRLSSHGNYVVKAGIRGEYLPSGRILDIVKPHVPSGATILPVGSIDADGSGYKSIARELYDAGVGNGWTVYVPVGGAELLGNLVLGFKDIDKQKMPRFVAATIEQNWLAGWDGKTPCEETPADKLVASHSTMEAAARELIGSYGIPVIVPSPEEIEGAFDYAGNKAGILTSRNSAVAFAAALSDAKAGRLAHGQKIAIINTGYEPEESGWADLGAAMKQYGRRAILAAAACLLPLALDSASLYTIQQRTLEREASVREYVNRDRERFAREPLLADINAYAQYMGSVEKTEGGRVVIVPDPHIMNDLTYWYFSNDMIALQMYNDRKSSMRRNIDGFRQWKEEREEAKNSGKGYWDFSNR